MAIPDGGGRQLVIEEAPFSANFPRRLHAFALRVRAVLEHVSIAHVQCFFAAVEAMPEPQRLPSIYWAGRFTLCATREDIVLYEVCFTTFFEGCEDLPGPAELRSAERVTGMLASLSGDGVAEQPPAESIAVSANEMEILRQRDFASLSQAELEEVLRLIAALRFCQPLMRTRQMRDVHRGTVHARRTVRAAIENHGEVARLVLARPGLRARRCVLLLDVSGSMKVYADPLLRFGYAMAHSMPRSTEVFSLSSRLARLTPVLVGVSAKTAMSAVARVMPDWGGGTRLGSGLQVFLDTWGQRAMARDAIVVIASDGWESGGAELLAEQMARLRRLAHWVIWVNPHKSSEGFEPVTAGMKAALPHVDTFLGGASLDELIVLGSLIGTVRASTRSGQRLP